MMLPPEWDVRIYKPVGSAWQRIDFPSRRISQIEWELLAAGGYGNARVVLETAWENYQLTGNERCDIYLDGNFMYRGRVAIFENNLQIEETKVVNLYGLVGLVGRKINTRYAYPSQVDISVIAADLFNDYVLPVDPNAVSDLSGGTGILMTAYDAVGKSFKQAMDGLIAFSPGQAYWGFDTALSGGKYQNRLYLRFGNRATGHFWPVGGNIKEALYPTNTDAVVNRIKILGGAAIQPNLVNNGGFEYPIAPDANHGNLLLDSGFEYGTGTTVQPGSWTLSPNASVKGGNDIGEGTNGANSGSNWLELDESGEEAQQTVAIDYTKPLELSLWVRGGTVGTTGIFSASVDGLDAGGSVVTTVTIASNLSVDAGHIVGYVDGIYSEIGPITCDFSAHATVTQARVNLIGNNGTNHSDGVAIDDVALYYRDLTVQNAWVSTPVNCPVSAVNWTQKATTPGDSTAPLEGAYCVKVTCSPSTGGYTELRTAPWAQIQMKIQRTYSLMIALRCPAGDSFAVSFGMTFYNQDLSVAADFESSTFTGGSDGLWHVIPFSTPTASEFVTGNAATNAEIYIRVRSSTPTYIDGVMLVEGPPPREYTDDQNYWEGSQYTKTYDVTSTDLTLNPGVSTSIATWGVRESFETQTLVIDKASAIAFAEGYLNKHALPEVQGRITLSEWTTPVTLDQNIKLVNLAKAPGALTPSRIQYQITKDVEVMVDVNDDRPDLAILLQEIKDRQTQPAAATGTSSAGYTPYNAGGGSGTGAPNDADLVHLDGTETITGEKTFTQPIRANGGYESSDGTAGATTNVNTITIGSKIADPTTALTLSLTTGLGGTFKAGDIVNLFYSWRTTNGYRTNVNTLATITITADNQSVSTNQPATIPAGAVYFDLWVQGSSAAGPGFPPKLFAPSLDVSAGAAINVLEYVSGGVGPPGENTTQLEGLTSGSALVFKDGLIT